MVPLVGGLQRETKLECRAASDAPTDWGALTKRLHPRGYKHG